MSGIKVLSDSLDVGSRLDKTSRLKGKNATDSLDNATTEFAAMLSGLTNIYADPIGQNSKNGQDLEAGQDPDSLVQNPGYGHFVLSFLSQPKVLGDLPAGKEANSGNGVNQGTGDGLSAEDNLSMVALSKLSLDSDEVFGTKGMTSQMPQGNNPGTSELDKYRQVIADLLVVLSGQITDSSPEGLSLATERGTSERQEIMKLVQGWLMVTDDVVKNVQAANTPIIDGQRNNEQVVLNIEGYTPSFGADSDTVDDQVHSKMVNTLSTSKGIEDLRQVIASTIQNWMQATDNSAEGESNSSIQKVIQPLIDFLTNEQGTRSQELSPKASSLLTVLNQIMSQVQETNIPQGVNKEMLQANSDKLEAIFNQPKRAGHVSETATATSKDTIFYPDSKQKLAEIDLLQSKSLKNLQGVSSEEGSKGDQAESSELSGVKTSQNQNSNLGIGFDGKIVTGNVADGKTVAIPVWEQISNVFREQVSSRNRELKELDIQLHPADLGRIRIGLRWENGQVHMQVHASEAVTGQLIQNQLTELRNTLTNQGVNCGMLEMGQQGKDQQQNQNHQENQFHRQHDAYTNQIEDEEQLPIVTLPSSGELNNRINVTA